MNGKILPLAAMEKLLKKGSPDIRVSDPAKEELRLLLEEQAVKLARTAAQFAVHAGRKTIKAEDVKLASKSKLD
jgi:histone H3/H4